LTPDDLSEFELAAMGREDSILAPPYDPELEEREVRRESAPAKVPWTPTEQLTAELTEADRFRLRVIRRHIRWMKKRAYKRGIDTSEVDLWQI